MKQIIKKALKALRLYNVVRSYFVIDKLKLVNLEWLDDGHNGVKWTECEPKDAKWQLRVPEPRYKWMKWLL